MDTDKDSGRNDVNILVANPVVVSKDSNKDFDNATNENVNDSIGKIVDSLINKEVNDTDIGNAIEIETTGFINEVVNDGNDSNKFVLMKDFTPIATCFKEQHDLPDGKSCTIFRIKTDNDNMYHLRKAETSKVNNETLAQNIDENVKKSNIFQCSKCNFSTKNSSKFTAHNSVHLDTNAFPCNQCDASFPHRASLTIHMKKHHTLKKPYICEICHCAFATTNEYIEHLKADHPDRISMKKSTMEFKTFGVEASNVCKVVIDGKARFQCELCHNSFSNVTVLKYHILSVHKKIRPFTCAVCSCCFSRGYDLKKHQKIHSQDKEFKCNLCPSSFPALATLTLHMRRYHNLKDYNTGRYECNYCHKTLSNKNNLKEHILSVHKKERSFVCSVCKASFYRNSLLQRHLLIHSGEKAYKCNLCDAKFAYRYPLACHMKKRHGVENSYKCEKCGLCFSTCNKSLLHKRICCPHKRVKITKKAALKIKNVLEPDNNLETVIISMDEFPTTNRQSDDFSEDFQVIQTNSAPRYGCNICQNTFSNKANVKDHIFSVHRKLRTFLCHICNASFYRNCLLKRHMKSHSGDKPHKCDFCNVGFLHKINLAKHRKICCHLGTNKPNGLEQTVSNNQYPQKPDVLNTVIPPSSTCYTNNTIGMAAIDAGVCSPVTAGIDLQQFETIAHHTNTSSHISPVPHVTSLLDVNTTPMIHPAPQTINTVQLVNTITNITPLKDINTATHINSIPQGNNLQAFPFLHHTSQQMIQPGGDVLLASPAAAMKVNMESSRGASDMAVDAGPHTVIHPLQPMQGSVIMNADVMNINPGYPHIASDVHHMNPAPMQTTLGPVQDYCSQTVNNDDIAHFMIEIGNSIFPQSADKSELLSTVDTSQIFYKCNGCNGSFNNGDELVYHMQTVHGSTNITSNNIAISNNNNNNANANSCNNSTNSNQLKCNDCGLAFASAREFNEHQKTHDCVRPFACHLCEARFTLKSSLTVHVRRRHTTERPFQCEICAKNFVTSSERRAHTKSHFTVKKPRRTCSDAGERQHKSVKRYECSECKKTYITRTVLKMHILTVHKHIKPHKCQICDMAFAKISLLNRHLISHSGEKPFMCEVCCKRFTQKGHLNTHKKRFHSIEGVVSKKLERRKQPKCVKSSKCVACNEQFSDKEALARHSEKCSTVSVNSFQTINGDGVFGTIDVRKDNNNVIKFKCQKCHQAFKSSNHFIEHGKKCCNKSLKSLIKKFECSQCNKSYTTKTVLKYHVSTVHENIRPYQCTVCDARFPKKSNVSRHLISHTGAKPFTCETCSAKFTQKYTLKVHMRRQHDIDSN